MKRLANVAAAVCLFASPVAAKNYHIVLDRPANGKMLVGHAGVQAVDDRTGTALVRLITPGAEVDQRGTVRVLVMNLGSTPFEFGPDQVKVALADGTVLQPTTVEKMEKGRELVERESSHAAANDLRTRNDLSALAQQGSGPTAQSMAPVQSPSGGTSAADLDRRGDDSLQPGADLLNAIYQVLVPLTVQPGKAWGGYYIFDVPKAVYVRKTDQPMIIDVTTGGERHRFAATLRWK